MRQCDEWLHARIAALERRLARCGCLHLQRARLYAEDPPSQAIASDDVVDGVAVRGGDRVLGSDAVVRTCDEEPAVAARALRPRRDAVFVTAGAAYANSLWICVSPGVLVRVNGARGDDANAYDTDRLRPLPPPAAWWSCLDDAFRVETVVSSNEILRWNDVDPARPPAYGNTFFGQLPLLVRTTDGAAAYARCDGTSWFEVVAPGFALALGRNGGFTACAVVRFANAPANGGEGIVQCDAADPAQGGGGAIVVRRSLGGGVEVRDRTSAAGAADGGFVSDADVVPNGVWAVVAARFDAHAYATLVVTGASAVVRTSAPRAGAPVPLPDTVTVATCTLVPSVGGIVVECREVMLWDAAVADAELLRIAAALRAYYGIT